MARSYEIRAIEAVKQFVFSSDIIYYIGKCIKVNSFGWISRAAKYANTWGNTQLGFVLWGEIPEEEKEAFETDVLDCILVRFSKDEYTSAIQYTKPDYINWSYGYLPSEIEIFICKNAMQAAILSGYGTHTTKEEWKELLEQYS